MGKKTLPPVDVYSIHPKGRRLKGHRCIKSPPPDQEPYDAFADPEFLARLPEEMAKLEKKFFGRKRKALEEMSQITAKDLNTMVG